eukprot:TRINITY_DN68452_c0_g1_i1.p1 TRINITY_DN68452_c0_g1~~TRINITY_DN68452_c0_g1_i1.p1  ORF type:complete len:426 (+),score=74.01 TRINITY_DN68452_c0_g1_i1:126-1403(+)
MARRDPSGRTVLLGACVVVFVLLWLLYLVHSIAAPSARLTEVSDQLFQAETELAAVRTRIRNLELQFQNINTRSGAISGSRDTPDVGVMRRDDYATAQMSSPPVAVRDASQAGADDQNAETTSGQTKQAVGASCPRFPHLVVNGRVPELGSMMRRHCRNRRLNGFAGHYLCPESFAALQGGLPPAAPSLFWDTQREDAFVRRMRTTPTPRLKVGMLEWYGSDQEDWYLFDLFFRTGHGGRPGLPSVPGGGDALAHGTFVEVGGNNGVHASNTLFYEKYLNWTGLLVEPTPCYYTMRQNRPTCHSVWAGICAEETTLDITSMLRFCRSVRPNTTVVRCAPMGKLMGEVGLRNVDLLSIDVEGAEATVLRSIDFAAIDVAVVLVEHLSHEKPEALAEKRSILEPFGYRMYPDRVGGNLVFYKCDLPP